jgi:NADH:ubiquinone oxidoreductase subunit 6 (subunit J)
MGFLLNIFVVVGALFLGIVFLLELGRRIRLARMEREGDVGKGVGAVEGAVYGLLGLLIAFTFSGAATRYDSRRLLIVEEANAIGTAYLRLDLLPAEARASLQDKFRQYVDSRLEVYQKLPDIKAAKAALDKSVGYQNAIWAEAVAAGQSTSSTSATMLLLPALNQMIDITTTRTVATQIHPPFVVYVLLVGLALVSALLAGFAMAENRSHNWLHTLLYAAVLSLAIYVILDLEYPRMGLIRIDAADQLLVDLRQSMR